jgi:hypothetical protein
MTISENGDLVGDSHNNLIKWKSYFSQLLNSGRDSEARQLEIYTAEPLIENHTLSEFEIAIAKLHKIQA